jgi:hypothetical protein
MSDIPSALNKIQIEGVQTRFPVSEDLLQTMGGSVNYLIDAFVNGLVKKTEFTSSGSFTVPADVSIIYLEGVGGGGGGSGSSGGCGGIFRSGIFTVTPSSVHTVTIGAAGAGSGGAVGGTGGDSSFGSILSFPGGSGGVDGGNFVIAFNGISNVPISTFPDVYIQNVYERYGGVAIINSGLGEGGPSPQGWRGGTSGSTSRGGGGAGPYGPGGNGLSTPSTHGAGGGNTASGAGGFVRVMYFSQI